MGFDEEVNIVFQTDSDSFQAKVTVPDDQDFTELKVLVLLTNPEEVNGTLGLFVNVGSNVVRPTSTAYNYLGEPIWNDGLGVFLSSDKIKPK